MPEHDAGSGEPVSPGQEPRRTPGPYVQPEARNPFVPNPFAPGPQQQRARQAPPQQPGQQAPSQQQRPQQAPPQQQRPQQPNQTHQAPAPQQDPGAQWTQPQSAPPAAGAPAAPSAPTPAQPTPQQVQVHRNAYAGDGPQGGYHDQQHGVSSRDLSTSLLLKESKPAPTSGWRKLLYTASGRKINAGNSAKEQRRIDLTKEVNSPLQGCYKIALLSLKGGVGKTTITATLGSTFASLRGDRVIAVDANPDRGTLSQKIPLETPATVRNLLRDAHSIGKYSDVRSYTSQSRHRLEVLASDADPAVSEAFSGDDYARTVELLEKFYSIVLTDCGTGLMHSAMQTILQEADALVVVSSGSVDGVRSASATLDWLDAHGYRKLVSEAVAVVNAVRPKSGKVDLPQVVSHFEQRCRQVNLIPFDPHLEEGAEIELERLRPETRSALLELAAGMATNFPTASNYALQGRVGES